MLPPSPQPTHPLVPLLLPHDPIYLLAPLLPPIRSKSYNSLLTDLPACTQGFLVFLPKKARMVSEKHKAMLFSCSRITPDLLMGYQA